MLPGDTLQDMDAKSSQVEKSMLRLLRLMCCFREGRYCWWVVNCCPLIEAPPSKPDIQYILQNSDLSDSESTSTTSLIRHQSGVASPSSSFSSVKDLKADIYHQIEMRRSNSVGSRKIPIIDIRPVEFWSGVKGEEVQPPRDLGGPSNPPAPYPKSPNWFNRKGHDFESLSKQFRPHLYTSASSSLEETIEEEFGRLHFSLHYDSVGCLLIVRIIEAADLPLPSHLDSSDHARSNPYVRISLIPDNMNARQTSIKKKTQDPVFEETFFFELSFGELTKTRLELKVKDFDKFSRHCIVGKLDIPLSEINLSKPCRMWKPLGSCTPTEEELGEVLLSMNYLPAAGRLNVEVIKARHLLRTRLEAATDPYAKVTLLIRGHHYKSKKTSVKKNTLEPSFRESFTFRITGGELRESAVVVTFYDCNPGVTKDEVLGRFILGQRSSGPSESNHWQEMLASERHSVAQWHSLHSKQHCNQVIAASRSVP